MKKMIRTIIMLLMGIMLISPFNTVKALDNIEECVKEYKDNIYNMSKMMRCIPKTGDINLDYLYEMALFTEGEIDFCEAYIKYASTDEIKNVATLYMERESVALENIKTVIEKLKDNPDKNDETEEKYLAIYNNALNETMCRFQKVELSEDINVDFLKFMIVHHNSVIKLTDEFLNMSDNCEVKEIANKLNVEMKKDLNTINKYV